MKCGGLESRCTNCSFMDIYHISTVYLTYGLKIFGRLLKFLVVVIIIIIIIMMMFNEKKLSLVNLNFI